MLFNYADKYESMTNIMTMVPASYYYFSIYNYNF